MVEAEEYCCYAVRERKKVEEFWGAMKNEPIRINVSSSYRISRALVTGHFGNRGFLEMPLRTVTHSPTYVSCEFFCIDQRPAVRAFADFRGVIVERRDGEAHFVVFYFQ